MSQVKDYLCRNCGSALEFVAGATETYCEFCGIQNILGEIDDLDEMIEKEFNDRFGAIVEQLRATGDPETRAYLFTRDLHPKLDAQMQELEEKYEEKFRFPLMHVPILAKVDRSLNISNALIKRAWNSSDMQTIVRFYSRELKLPIFKVMAQTEQLEASLSKMGLRSQHLANIYFIRGYSLELKDENLKIMSNFLNRAIMTVNELLKIPPVDVDDKLENSRLIMYKFWHKRFAIYQEFLETLQIAMRETESYVGSKFQEFAAKCDNIIEELKTAEIPLFLSIPFMDGFMGDKNVFLYFSKIAELCETFDRKFEFRAVFNIIESFLTTAMREFDNLQSMPQWDSKWIEKVTDPITTIFNLISNLQTAIQTQKGNQEATFFREGFQFSDGYVVSENTTCKPRKDEILVRQKINIYVPFALASTYSILTKGFLWMKAGEDFDGTLLVNTLFNQDNLVSSGLYVNAVSLLDFSLKEKDKERVRLNSFLDAYENTTPKSMVPDGVVLPMTTTIPQVEEFISKTYDLFDVAQTNKYEPISGFNKLFKSNKFEKNLERLNGEVTDVLYIPLSLVLLARGKMKKGVFQPKEEFHWKIISPFPLEDRKNRDPDDLLGIQIDANGLLNTYEVLREIASEPKLLRKGISPPTPYAVTPTTSPNTIICPSCGTPSDPSSKFCGKCGSRLKAG